MGTMEIVGCGRPGLVYYCDSCRFQSDVGMCLKARWDRGYRIIMESKIDFIEDDESDYVYDDGESRTPKMDGHHGQPI